MALPAQLAFAGTTLHVVLAELALDVGGAFAAGAV